MCSQIVLKLLYLARIGRPDILWSVNKLARSITKWTKACDKRQSRLISYMIQNLLQVEHCVSSEATRSFQPGGCVRNKLQFRAAQRNQKSLEAGLRMNGIHAIDLWDLIVTVLH